MAGDKVTIEVRLIDPQTKKLISDEPTVTGASISQRRTQLRHLLLAAEEWGVLVAGPTFPQTSDAHRLDGL